jgi:ligand-binding SRPBCC domain-containing protein
MTRGGAPGSAAAAGPGGVFARAGEPFARPRVSLPQPRDPMLHRLYTTQWLPLSLDEAWDFFSSPRNLARITPPDMRFEILEGADRKTYAGQLIRYRVRPMWNIPMGWTTEITHCVERDYFVDEQRFGPYKLWHHLHRFTEKDGGVWMEDDLHYALYGGPLAPLVNRIVEPRVRQIFDYRRVKLEELFGKPDTVRLRPAAS